QAAQGDIIAQLDADCVPCKRWISLGVHVLERSNAVAVTGPYDYADASFFLRACALVSQWLLYPLINTAVQLVKRGGILIGGNTFVRAGILQDAGGYNTSFTFYGDDAELAQRLS